MGASTQGLLVLAGDEAVLQVCAQRGGSPGASRPEEGAQRARAPGRASLSPGQQETSRGLCSLSGGDKASDVIPCCHRPSQRVTWQLPGTVFTAFSWLTFHHRRPRLSLAHMQSLASIN